MKKVLYGLARALRWFGLAALVVLSGLSTSCSGIPARVAAERDFTFVILPDTQYMVGSALSGSPVWKSMCEWIVKNRKGHNIQAVLSVGDITDHGTREEFSVASEGLALIEAAGIPCIPIVGNHDYERAPGTNVGTGASGRRVAGFDSVFGPKRFEGKSWYGGSLDGSHANYYVKLDVHGRKFIVVALEFLPRKATVAWASTVLDANTDAQAIVLTHGYLNPNGARSGRWDRGGPVVSGVDDGYSGEDLWDQLIGHKANILAVICGHLSSFPYTAHRSDPGDAGNNVHQILIDYQYDNGGDGWVGLLRFHPSLRTAEVSSYRTYAPSGLGYDPNAPTYSLSWPDATPAFVTGTEVSLPAR